MSKKTATWICDECETPCALVTEERGIIDGCLRGWKTDIGYPAARWRRADPDTDGTCIDAECTNVAQVCGPCFMAVCLENCRLKDSNDEMRTALEEAGLERCEGCGCWGSDMCSDMSNLDGHADGCELFNTEMFNDEKKEK